MTHDCSVRHSSLHHSVGLHMIALQSLWKIAFFKRPEVGGWPSDIHGRPTLATAGLLVLFAFKILLKQNCPGAQEFLYAFAAIFFDILRDIHVFSLLAGGSGSGSESGHAPSPYTSHMQCNCQHGRIPL